MARKDPALRDYAMSDGDLIQKADDLKGFVLRDAAQFANRNVEDTATMDAARNLFAATPTDDLLAGLVTVAAQAKDAARDVLEDAVASLRNMAELAHGGTRGLYKTYGFDGFSNLDDNDAFRQAKTIAFVANNQIGTLSAEGYSSGGHTQLLAKIAAFDTAVDAVKQAEATRDTKTQERVMQGNALFKEVSRLSSIGQALFVNTDEAKYNDYVLDEGGNGNEEPDPGGGGPTDPPNG